MHRALTLAQTGCCLGLMLWAACAQALDGAAKTDAKLLAPLVPVITPVYLENRGSLLNLNQNTSWQLGGINSQFDVKEKDSALSVRGGMYYSRALGMRQVIDRSSTTRPISATT